ncbi:ROK family protein [Bacillus sp. B15-48]|uniref:ROK family transcriptional regulator n=1 Tax=Bacillus sp. B15-48 TaxID=1548601 RepID=UPI00193EF934|nr:ROK family protein [Bacillus sp. B15-48]MBM4761194.1 ROK family protein [Bacillus sp. B15-48]
MTRQKTWNNQVVKQKNKETVLTAITTHAPISRADIAQRVGLNKATVSSLVNELIEEELIYESGPGESSGGRRPVMLLFNHQAGYSIGIDIGVNYVLGVLTDLKGHVVGEKLETITSSHTDELISLVNRTIHFLIQSAPQSTYGIIGIGIGVPGIIDRSGKVLMAPNLKWEDLDLKGLFTQEFDYPIFIENEANAGAYGEKQYGAGKHHDSIVYFSVGIGIGTGIILNGELYQGINGYSGESGHTTIFYNGRPCTCGNRGCWEAYASEFALLKHAEQELKLTDPTLEELIQLADEGNVQVVELFEKIGHFIGVGITNSIKMFNPQQIIIGNRMAKARHLMETSIIDTVKSRTYPFHLDELEISFSELSTYSAAIGVAAFATENFLKISKEI